MHDFRYVTKNEAKPIKKELYRILYDVQDLVRDKFTFSFTTVGSSSHNMITYDAKSNIGFDFDINIEVNDDNEDFRVERNTDDNTYCYRPCCASLWI